MHIDNLRSQKCEIPGAFYNLDRRHFLIYVVSYFLWTLNLGRSLSSIYLWWIDLGWMIYHSAGERAGVWVQKTRWKKTYGSR